MTSGRTGAWIVIQIKPGVDVIDAVDWVRSVWPVTVHVDCVGPRRSTTASPRGSTSTAVSRPSTS